MRLWIALISTLISCSLPTLAQTPDPCATAPASCATLIQTHATSEMRISNTAVDITVSVNASGKNVAEVQRNLATNSNTLVGYLKLQNVDRLITSRIAFSPENRYRENNPDKTVGYTGTSSVSFRTTPEKAADLLAGVLSNGANEIESTTFTPTEKEIADARRQLSEKATHEALEQAEAIAKAAGMHVVAIRNIDVNGQGLLVPRPVSYATMQTFKAAAPVAMQTSAGEQDLSATVNITAAATH